ncbi:hypothetical protein QS257_16280 [Terrilactibacillus sp. S3-3]|nr:hypothetical protein QS257_16280 [Terrilactibacillus sp. S3-3]
MSSNIATRSKTTYLSCRRIKATERNKDKVKQVCGYRAKSMHSSQLVFFFFKKKYSER